MHNFNVEKFIKNTPLYRLHRVVTELSGNPQRDKKGKLINEDSYRLEFCAVIDSMMAQTPNPVPMKIYFLIKKMSFSDEMASMAADYVAQQLKDKETKG